MQELNELHRLVTRSFKERFVQDLQDNVSTDAATLGAAIKFLKDNEVSADPADKDDLAEMRARLTAVAAQRRDLGKNVVALAARDLDDDLSAMEG
jgi:hypothetical protein